MIGNQMRHFDWNILTSRLDRFKSLYNLTQDSKALIFLFFEEVFGLGEEEIHEVITDGPDDRGTDAVFIASGSEIHLFQFKFHTSAQNSQRNFPSTEIDKISTFIDDIFRVEDVSELACSPKLREKAKMLKSAFGANLPELHIWLCSNGNPLSTQHRERFEKTFQKYNFISTKEFTIDDFVAAITHRRKSDTQHTFKLLGQSVVEQSDGDIRGIVGKISATELVKMITDPADGNRINQALFEQNIRSFLGLSNTLNKTIFRSAISRENHKFWYLNNGITFVCESYSYPSGIRDPAVMTKNLQIVNGAQTSSAIFEAYKESSKAMENLRILVRLFATEDEAMAHKIAVSTNSQNRVMPRDLMANDDFQIRLEQGLKDHGIAYIRKRGEDTYDKSLEPLDAMKAGQIILSYFLGEPERAKRDSDRIFGDLYHDIFNPSITVSQIVDAYEIYKRISFRRDGIEEDMKREKIEPVNHEFVMYGTFHILYMVSILKREGRLRLEEIDTYIDSSIQHIAAVLRKKGNPAYYTFFRSPRTKLDLMNQASQFELDLS